MAKINMKNLVGMAALAIIAVSNQANATTACTGTATRININGGSGATTVSTFFKSGFTVQCSNNVIASYTENSANLLTVAAGSIKGNQVVAGNSNGGAIKVVGTCTGTNQACVASDINTTGLTAGST